MKGDGSDDDDDDADKYKIITLQKTDLLSLSHPLSHTFLRHQPKKWRELGIFFPHQPADWNIVKCELNRQMNRAANQIVLFTKWMDLILIFTELSFMCLHRFFLALVMQTHSLAHTVCRYIPWPLRTLFSMLLVIIRGFSRGWIEEVGTPVRMSFFHHFRLLILRFVLNEVKN